MRRAYALVEGQTEEAFVESVLRPHLWQFDLDLTPIIVTTKRTRTTRHTGGVSSWSKVEKDLQRLLGDSSVGLVTTMLDFYGLPSDTPGMSDRPDAAQAAAAHIESAIATSLPDRRLNPFVVLHELEALLYADPATVGRALGSPEVEAMMIHAVAPTGEPELVNDGPTTAPSKRILATFPGFAKTSDGPALLKMIGLAKIRQACPHFAAWLHRLESL